MNFIPIKYVGLKDEQADHDYGTGLTWRAGETLDVPEDKVPLLLMHPDVWEDARTKAEKKKRPIEPYSGGGARFGKRFEEATDPIPTANLGDMSDDAVREYALREFGARLEGEGESLRSATRALMMQRQNDILAYDSDQERRHEEGETVDLNPDGPGQDEEGDPELEGGTEIDPEVGGEEEEPAEEGGDEGGLEP